VIATTTPAGADGSLRHAAMKRRREQMEMMLARARQRGEKPPDVDELWIMCWHRFTCARCLAGPSARPSPIVWSIGC
jgi:hypothetical protein